MSPSSFNLSFLPYRIGISSSSSTANNIISNSIHLQVAANMNPPARNNKQNTPQLFDNNNELELDDDDNINSNLSSSINNIQQHQQNQDSSQQQISTENTVIVEYDLDSPISPLDENEPIDFSLVYALHTFVANLEGQVCVLKGDSLELLDDSNSYWWLVKCLKTEEVEI